MVKEKNIIINIHNAPIEKKKKRRRRRKGKSKSKYAAGNPVQGGGAQTYFNPSTVAVAQQKEAAQREAQEYSHNYLSNPKPKTQNLLLDNGDEEHGDRQRLLLGDVPPSAKKESKTFNTSFKNYKPKIIEYTVEKLSNVKTLKELRSIMKDAKPDITDQQLKQINNKNKDAAIKLFLTELDKKPKTTKSDVNDDNIDRHVVQSQDAHTSPEFIDQTSTTKPISVGGGGIVDSTAQPTSKIKRENISIQSEKKVLN